MPPSTRPVLYLGVDPGASGALAFGRSDRGLTSPGVFLTAGASAADIYEAVGGVRAAQEAGVKLIGTVEKVGGFIGTAQPGAAMFKFGFNAGLWTMALVACAVAYEEVTPQAWQKGLKIPGRTQKESKPQWKRRLRAKAQQLFPGLKVTLDTADALLIMEYTQRKYEGRL